MLLSRRRKPVRVRAGAFCMTNPNSAGPVLLEVDDRKVAHVILNRPEVNNAYDGDLIQSMLAALDALARVSGLSNSVTWSGRRSTMRKPGTSAKCRRFRSARRSGAVRPNLILGFDACAC